MASHLDTVLQNAVQANQVPAVGGVIVNKSGEQIYDGAFGSNNANDSSAIPYTNDTECLIASCTKLVTSICALQLVEQGKLSLDDPVAKYQPWVANLQVMTGWEGGRPKTRPASKTMKIVHLLTHTSGITYDFTEDDRLMYEYRIWKGQKAGENFDPSAEWQYKDLHLLSEPGDRFQYGQSIDVLGFVIDKISGLPVEEYMAQNVFQPLGMSRTGPSYQAKGGKHLAVHYKSPDGLTALPELVPDKPEYKYGAGHFLVSTLNDYSQLLLTLLNDGTHPLTGKQILRPETVQNYLFTDCIHDLGVSRRHIGIFLAGLTGTVNAGDVVEHLKLSEEHRGWSLGLMTNLKENPGYRSVNSGSWAGLANIYFWIDRTKGVAGIVGTNVLPFLDKDMLSVAEQFERIAYQIVDGR